MDALRQGADTLITGGALQSNHARQTAAAAAAARAGLRCILVLQERVVPLGPSYTASGNLLLSRLLGAEIFKIPKDADLLHEMRNMADSAVAQGRRPYVIPIGGSNAIGSLGYVECANEILTQSTQLGFSVDHVVLASGSAGTQAGLIVGFSSLGAPVKVTGVSVGDELSIQKSKVAKLATELSALLGEPSRHLEDKVFVDDSFIGDGYGIPNESVKHAIESVAQSEGILLDPVYSGKAMTSLIQGVKTGRYKKKENIVFLHTGGNTGLFGYEEFFS